ncbi:MAG: dihydrolipoyl dehydrogenase family protein [Actinomycetes bacterium]
MSQQAEHHITDVVVVGGGPTGENVAARAVRGGLDVVLVEAELVGGECSFWACMPSKALLRPGHALAATRRLPGAAGAVTRGLDVAGVLQRRDTFAEHWDDADQVAWAEDAGVAVVRGRGRLVGERTVEVTAGGGDRTTWTARRAVVLATGSEPVVPPIQGLAGTAFWGSREATSAKQVPGRLAVIGGGVVAVELAQAFARLGSQVTVVSHSRLLSRAEERAGELVADALAEDGVDLRVGVRCTTVAREGGDGEVTLTLDGGERVAADELLVATGRRPRTHDIGLDGLGLDPGQPLEVDASGRVTAVDGDWLYAAGDVTGQAPLTHMGKYAGRITADAIAARADGGAAGGDWSRHTATALSRAVTQVVFTDPEVVSVGLTSQQAEDAGIDHRVVDLDIAVAGSSLHADGYTGWARMVVDEERRVLVGVTFVGQDVAELLHSATVAVVGEVPLDRLWHAVPAFPTISEVWLRLLEEYGL